MAASAILIAVESEMSPSPSALGANTKNSTPHWKTAAAKRSRLRPTTRKRNEEKRTASEVQAASRGRRTAGARAARPVRELHRQMQARQGWRYPADDVSRRRWRMQGAGGQAAASGCGTTSPKKDEGRAAEREQGAMRGLFRRRSGAERFRPRRAVQDSPPRLT